MESQLVVHVPKKLRDKRLLERLSLISAKRGESRSSLVVEAILDYLEREESCCNYGDSR